MKRSKPLRTDPGKMRDWQDRSRDSLARSQFGLEGKPVKVPKRTERKTVPPSVRAVVRARSKGMCVVCVFTGHKGRGFGKAEHLHHVWAKQRFPEHAEEPDGLVGVCQQHHMDHEFAPGKRIPLAALPRCVFEMYARVSEPARAYFDRVYGAPTGGSLR